MGTKTFRELTTFRVGGRIKEYREVSNTSEIFEAVDFSQKNKLPIFILGGGSDILVNDSDFDGMVIKFVGTNIKINEDDSVTAQSGVNWDDLVKFSVENNLQGIECLSGIPGTAGAAPIQNIGAYGQELSDTFVSLTAVDIENREQKTFSKDDCKFSYRESIFKEKNYWQKYLITDITLKLNKGAKPLVKYESLINFLNERSISKPSLLEVRNAVLEIRSKKFEDPKEVGNAGSFFKNPILTKDEANTLLQIYKDIPLRLQNDGTYKSFAGWFIENVGWKGKNYKTAAVSKHHALILINPDGKAVAEDVAKLADKIISDVFDKFRVKLEPEVQFINF